jgi:hypothetical protein
VTTVQILPSASARIARELVKVRCVVGVKGTKISRFRLRKANVWMLPTATREVRFDAAHTLYLPSAGNGMFSRVIDRAGSTRHGLLKGPQTLSWHWTQHEPPTISVLDQHGDVHAGRRVGD